MSNGGALWPPFTRVSAPERQASTARTRNVAADPRTSCSSCRRSKCVPDMCSASAAAGSWTGRCLLVKWDDVDVATLERGSAVGRAREGVAQRLDVEGPRAGDPVDGLRAERVVEHDARGKRRLAPWLLPGGEARIG